MDASTLERIVGIVRDMKASGMGQDDITDNLRQMGVADSELSGILAKAGLAAPVPSPPQPIAPPASDEHFDRLHTAVSDLHAKHDDLAGSLGGLSDLRREIQGIKADIAEIKPMIGALKRLNENLIDINKKMLARLGAE